MEQITLSVASILGIIVGCILYGISTVMFAWTLWALVYNKSNRINKVMLTATLLLFILGTFHIIVDSRRAYLGLIVSDAFFLDTKYNTFENSINAVVTLIADSVLIYRCYIVWRDYRVIILSVILWMTTIATAIHSTWSISRLSAIGEGLFIQQTTEWVVSFYSTALATNLITTSLLAYRIWRINAAVSATVGPSETFNKMNPRIRSVLLVIMECGALYSLALTVMLAVYVSKSNGSYIMFDIIVQIIPITFYVIIIRTSLHQLTEKERLTIYNQRQTTSYSLQSNPARNVNRVVIHVNDAALTKNDTDSNSAVGVTSDKTRSSHSLV